ncbi:MAG: hypothetical protein J6Y06_07815 [Bacteroidales bacterium]|nr:hypothetical protein [Bacteroidales bacterium]
MKKKLMYEVPDAELIELKLDSALMQGSPTPGEAGPTNGYDDQGCFGDD